MLKRTFDQSFRSGMAILFQQSLIQAAAVDTNADGDLLILTYIHNSLHPVFPADIAGVDTDLG